MKKLFVLLVLVAAIAACTFSSSVTGSIGGSTDNPTDQTSEETGSAQFTNFAAAGPEGVQDVKVSDGVMLLTPGQTYNPAPAITLSAQDAAGAEPESQPTIDPSTVEMPEGITLYAGATGLVSPDLNDSSGMDTKYVSFYSSDPGDQIMSFYQDEAAAAGWTLFSSDLGVAEADKYTGIWTKDDLMLNIIIYPPENGLAWVYITWMKM